MVPRPNEEETMAKTASGLLLRALEQIKVVRTGNRDRSEPATWIRLGAGSWIILILLLALLIFTGFIIYRGWALGDGTDVPAFGYAAMVFGVIISLAIGFGLMALIFYSSRAGYDEPPVLIAPDDDSGELKDDGAHARPGADRPDRQT
jgi:hypothetical protein